MLFLRKLLIRAAQVLAGIALLALAVAVNLNQGEAILSGLLSPQSPMDIVVSVARLVLPAMGLWLVYRGLI